MQLDLLSGNTPVIVIDSETHLIAPYQQTPRLVCVQIDDARGARIVTRGEAGSEIRAALGAAIDGRAVVVGHNLAMFDLLVFVEHDHALWPLVFDALESGNVIDTRVVERLLQRQAGDLGGPKAPSVSLDAIAQRRLGVKLDKGAGGWRLRYAELEDAPVSEWPERAREYALDDVRRLRQVWRSQIEQARAVEASYPGVLGTAAMETRAAFALGLMRSWGLVTDRGAVDALRSQIEIEVAAKREILRAAGLIRVAGSKRAPKWTLDTKRILAHAQTLGVDTREAWKLRSTRDPALCAVADYTHLTAKALGTYVPLLQSGILEPIHARVESMVASGRTSTSEPNIQNIPREAGFHECFVPRAGRAYCAVDFDCAELRSLAQTTWMLVGDRSRMAALFRADPHADPHLTFGCETLLRISMDEARARGGVKDKEIKAARQRAKAANFGFPGLMGARRFAANSAKDFWARGGAGVVFSESEAQDLLRAYKQQWPELEAYWRAVDQIPGVREGHGCVRSPVSEAWRGGCAPTDAANNAYQSTTAYGAKLALWAVARACFDARARSVLYGSRIAVFVHDEIVCEVPLSSASECEAEMTRIMIAAFRRAHPDVPVSAAGVLMSCWSKDAKKIVGQDGRTAIWSPRREP
jgi:DNA polymerase I-like protein with 3'-5' exonuclease and polymerase domains